MSEETTGAAIEDYFVEDRTFPPPEDFKQQTLAASPFLYDEADEDYQGFWAKQAGGAADVVPGLGHELRVGPPLREVVRRREAQRVVQLPRPARRGGPRRQSRVPLGGGARRRPHDHLCGAVGRSAEVRQRVEVARRQEGRPRRHLHAD